MDRAKTEAENMTSSRDLPENGVEGNVARAYSFRRIFGLIWNIGRKNSFLALFDQGIVSATRFITSVLIGRICGPEDLGFYVIAFAVLLLAMAVQEALITKPYTVFSQKQDKARNGTFAGSILLQHGILSFLIAVLSVSIGAIMSLFEFGHSKLALVILLLAVMIPFTLLWDLLRRIAFAHLRMRQAAVLDAALAVLQLSLLVGLAYFGQLYLQSAVLAITFATGFIGMLWLGLRWNRFRFDPAVFTGDCRRNWKFGNWILASQIIGTLHGYAVPWVLTFLLGAAATGIFVAAQSIVQLTNPLILGLGNWLGPRAAMVAAQAGFSELRKLIHMVSAVISAVMIIFAIVLYFAGAFALEILYGDQYQNQHWVIVILGICPVVWSLSMIFGNALAVIEQTRAVFWGTISGLAMTVLLVVPLAQSWALEGAAIALFIGSAISAIHLFVAFHLKTAEPPAESGAS